MGLNKQYDGYSAYSYVDNSEFDTVELIDASGQWRPMDLVPLTAEQEERAKRLMADSIVISLHEHPCLFPKDMHNNVAYKHSGRQFMAYQALANSCLDAVFDNMMDGTCVITSKNGWKWTDIIHDLGMRLCDLAQQKFVIRGATVDDIVRAHNEGKLALVPALEGPGPIENEVERIDVLYGLGVRQMGISYSQSSLLGGGIQEDSDGGLTMFGRKAIRRMNEVGMLIDCSHAGDLTTMETIQESRKPIMLTHTGARALWNSKRLKGDDVLRMLADKGGVVGVEAAPHTTITRNNRAHSIDSIMEHFVDLVGIDHVAFGPDTLYGDHVGLHKAFSSHLAVKNTQSADSFTHVDYVRGMENPTEASLNIVRWLVKRDYSDEDIRKVIGGNAMRVLKEVWH